MGLFWKLTSRPQSMDQTMPSPHQNWSRANQNTKSRQFSIRDDKDEAGNSNTSSDGKAGDQPMIRGNQRKTYMRMNY